MPTEVLLLLRLRILNLNRLKSSVSLLLIQKRTKRSVSVFARLSAYAFFGLVTLVAVEMISSI